MSPCSFKCRAHMTAILSEADKEDFMPCIHLEIIYQGSHCPASHYMDKAVEEVLPLYGEQVRYTRVEYKKSQAHSQRFLELSVSLFGESAVRLGCQLAPIPSLFIDGKLIFEVIPRRDELEIAIETSLMGQKIEL